VRPVQGFRSCTLIAPLSPLQRSEPLFNPPFFLRRSSPFYLGCRESILSPPGMETSGPFCRLIISSRSGPGRARVSHGASPAYTPALPPPRPPVPLRVRGCVGELGGQPRLVSLSEVHLERLVAGSPPTFDSARPRHSTVYFSKVVRARFLVARAPSLLF